MKWDVILGITSSVGLFHACFLIGCLLLIKKGDRAANVILALILAAFAVRIFKSTYYALTASMLWYLPILGLFGMSLNGPLLVFYAKHLQRESFSKKDILPHLVLPAFTLFNLLVENQSLLRASYLLVIIAQVVYIAYVAWQLPKHDGSGSRRWLTDLTTAFAFVEAIYFLQWTRLDDMAYIIATCVSSLAILVLTYLGLLKHDVFRKVHHYRLAPDEDDTELRSLIRKKIIDEEGFRDSELSLRSLADSLKVPSARITAAIQREFNKTFPELVNDLRLRYVTGRLQQPFVNEKVESLAFDAGFQSSSSFYAHFKKTFKMTPSEYRAVHGNKSLN